MKYVDEYRDRKLADALRVKIDRLVTRPWVIMEVCGGQTHAIVRYGVDRMMPADGGRRVEIVHGPGCPVCVTPLEMIDQAHATAGQPDVIFTSFGDMLRVPGSRVDLLILKSRGADVRIVYSPLDAVRIAKENPRRRVVFFGIGFETTAPANAMAVHLAREDGVRNFSMLASHVLVPPALQAILEAPENRVQGFLGPGHVCAVMGTSEYEVLCQSHRVPIVVAGFEPIDLLDALYSLLRQLEEGRAELENPYTRIVARDGNLPARALIENVFEVTDRKWRGIGSIPASGLKLRPEYRDHDAQHLFDVSAIATEENATCISGLILRGLRKPHDCPAFGRQCTPEAPLGATMVSSEGACAAHYLYRQGAGAATGAA